MPQEFDPRSVARRYSFLSKVPVELRGFVFASQHGEFEERVAGVASWAEALRAGQLPPPASWPGDAVSAPARMAIEQLDVLRFARQEPAIADELLRMALGSFEHHGTRLARDIESRIRELEQLERRVESDHDRPSPRQSAKETVARLRQAAKREIESRPAAADVDIAEAFEARVRVWRAVSEVFGDLGTMLGRGFDLSIGVLRHVGWNEVVRLSKLLEGLPQLRQVISALGRMQSSDADEQTIDRILEPMRRLEEELRERVVPGMPPDVRGIERSGEIQRMLPSESVLLTHPRLRMLWHARRIERALMTYRVEGVQYERVQVEREVQVEAERRRPRPNRGPIVAVIDTSGSMHGLPETVAKAVVLQALRTAQSEKRRCYALAYSGPGQVMEHELSLTAEGLAPLLAFLGQSFHGGTDIGAVHRVIELMEREDWRKADVMLATDGQWVADAALQSRIAAARAGGTRFHGIQIGVRGPSGLTPICDHIHTFSEWAGLLGRGATV
jgi:uncharacterized protein with von Willebrand factor type A (vWA) domain